MRSEPLGKSLTLSDSSTAYNNSDSHRHDPFCHVLNMELLQFYYSQPPMEFPLRLLSTAIVLGGRSNKR